MSNLPDNVSDSDPSAPWNEKEHDPRCPLAEDAPEMCECGHEMAQHSEHTGKCWIEIKTGVVCKCDGAKKTEPECECYKLGLEAESDRAEAAYERSRGDV